MNGKFNYSQLTKIREARGLTMSQLARQLAITPASISAWETGKSYPLDTHVIKLSNIFKVHIEYFFKVNDLSIENRSPVFFRSNADTLATQKKMAYRQVEWLSELIEIISSYVVLPEIKIKNICSSDRCDYDMEEIEDLAILTRRAMGIKGDGPIENTISLSECSGIVVSKFAISNSMDAFSVWVKVNENDRPLILLDTIKDSPGRLRFNLCHELGHLVLHKNLSINSLDRKVLKEIERQANYFSGAFLMPKELFSQRVKFHGTDFDDILQLKKEWRVSMTAIIHRMADLDLIDRNESDRLYKKMSRLGFRKREPGDEFIPFEEPTIFKSVFDIVKELNIDFGEIVQKKIGINGYDLNSLVGEKIFNDEFNSLSVFTDKVVNLQLVRNLKSN